MDEKLAYLALFFGFIFISVMGYFAISGPLTRSARASSLTPSQNKSLILAYPLIVSADAVTTSKIDIFLTTDDDKPVKGRQVELITDFARPDRAQVTTDEHGQATFHVTSDQPGSDSVSFSVDGRPFATSTTITFE